MLVGKAHKFGDDISADIHIFDKHSIFSRKDGDDVLQSMADKMLERLDPDFRARRRRGDFIVAGRNFGALSMYDQSAAIVKAGGIAAVIARSFDDLFVRHAVNRGLLLIGCDTASIATGDELGLDIEAALVHCKAKRMTLPCRVPHPAVLAWHAEGGVISYLQRHGAF